MPTCANCGTENPEAARYCMACARPLEAGTPAREVRKTVTVVFCDVTGSTALGERLDPESLRKVMARYFDAARARVERHGGTVEKFIGDAVMAVFGIPKVHEDDALRAVRAAAEIRETVADLSKELERDLGTKLEVRIGVNTGEVVAGDSAAGQALVTGDPVNVAARLEQAAEPGEVLIGAATHRLVRDAVVAEPTEPLSLKGKSAPVGAYLLRDVHPTAPAMARRLDSPLVGRERELRLLREAFDRTEQERACYLFTVLGPAGVGKSRLLEEFLGGLTEARVLRGRCLPYGEGITFFPVVELLKQAAGIADFEDPRETERKICALVEGEEQAAVVCARIGQLLGLTEGEAVPEETLWAIRRFLEALARDRSLVVVLDDVQWGETAFVDLVDHVADWTRDAPILLVCLARPDLLDARPAWGGGKLNATSILLEPLGLEECRRLVANLLGEADVAQEVQGRILDAAEGNPLFVEQMVSMLIDDGLLVRDDGRWVPTADLSAVPVPPTITALLAARLDRLTAEERAVLERASVVGKVFFRGAVAHLSPEGDRGGVDGPLMSLVRKELIRPDRTTLPGEDAFRFRHLLIRDAAYESTSKEVRSELHERFAEWLEVVAGERIEEQEEILGYHLEQAYRYREQLGSVDGRGQELAGRASGHLAAAGRRAFARGDLAGTAKLLSRAVALLPRGDPHRRALMPELWSALSEGGDFPTAANVIGEALEEARAARDRRIEAHARMGDVMLRVYSDPEGTGEEATRVADELIPLFEELGDAFGLSRAFLLRTTAPWMLARYAEMAADSERAGFHARRAGSPGDERLAMDMFGVAMTFGPIPVEEAIRRLEELRDEIAGQPYEFGGAIAVLSAMAGRFDEARAAGERFRAAAEELGRTVWLAGMSLGMGIVESLAGDFPAAERELRHGRELFLQLGEKGVLSTLSAALAHALCDQQRFDEAEPLIEESRGLSASDDAASQIGWRTARARVLAARGELEAAEQVASEAVEIGRGTDAPDMTGDAISYLAQIDAARGREDEASALLQEAIELYERKGNVVSSGRVRSLLDDLGR